MARADAAGHPGGVTTPSPEVSPRRDAQANVDPSVAGALNTAARALVVGAALGTTDALTGMQDDVGAIGFERLPEPWDSWAERADLHDASNVILREYGRIDEIRSREASNWLGDGDQTLRPQRTDLWPRVARGDRAACVAWLRLLMTDHEPVAAASAATALADWDHEEDAPVPSAFERARQLTLTYTTDERSPMAQQIASAAVGDRFDTETETEVPAPPTEAGKRGTVSLLVHGTAAWKGAWWFPQGDFHDYVLAHIRPDLYSGGRPFSWSGKYKQSHREVAAKRLALWASGDSLNTVFAHSYGGVIALLATTHGLTINELVLLSVPAEKVDVDWDRIARAVSLRIHLDLVLLAARRKQAFNLPVSEHFLPRWFRGHADSHDIGIWHEHDVARALGLTTSSV
jgi:hypothetical protein